MTYKSQTNIGHDLVPITLRYQTCTTYLSKNINESDIFALHQTLTILHVYHSRHYQNTGQHCIANRYNFELFILREYDAKIE